MTPDTTMQETQKPTGTQGLRVDAQGQPNRILRRSDVLELLNQEGPCVSIYFPTHRSGAEIEQDPIRLKNALREAEQGLAAAGLDEDECAARLKPARALLEEHEFWQHQSDGLAIFLSKDTERFLRLPIDFPELVVVGDEFHLTALLPLLSKGGRFHVLALSQNNVQLFSATRHRIAEIELPDAIPDSLADALGYDWEQKSLQFRVQPGVGGSDTMYHGQGAGHDDHDKELRRFMEILDKGLRSSLTDEVPLVLAGVEENTAMFRLVSKIDDIAEPTVSGNVDDLSAKQIHEKVVEAVGPLFGESLRKATERFEELGGSERVSTDLEDIVVATNDGRTDTLFVPAGRQVWGTLDVDKRSIEVHQEKQEGDVDLLDLAAIKCLSSSGEVFVVKDHQVPPPVEEPADSENGSSGADDEALRVAAILRY